jgi:hypothetical protein
MPKPRPYVDNDCFDIPQDAKATRLGGGRNSQTFRLDIPDRAPMVLKRYFVDPRDKRDRQGTEARALKFLEAMEVRQAPLLLNINKSRQASLLSFIPGDTITEPAVAHMDLAARFLVRLLEISATEKAREAGFFPASEAFFSATGVVKNIEDRLARLENVDKACPMRRDLLDFLECDLRPTLARRTKTCHNHLEVMRMTMDEEIPESWRILSPSDFGLHNAVVHPDGDLSFFDYEYFGWDDPSKNLADFCLHPGMNLPDALCLRFLSGVLPSIRAKGYNPNRAKALFPLFGVKWCCILLNEFVPRDLARRSFAWSQVGGEPVRMLRRQLDKAKKLLHSLDHRAEIFARHLDSL